LHSVRGSWGHVRSGGVTHYAIVKRTGRGAVVPSRSMNDVRLRAFLGLLGSSALACAVSGPPASAGESSGEDSDGSGGEASGSSDSPDGGASEGESGTPGESSAGTAGDEDGSTGGAPSSSSDIESETTEDAATGAPTTTPGESESTTVTGATAADETQGSGASAEDSGESGGVSTSCEGGQLQSGFYVENGKLYDNHCQEFIMRGVNFAYTWFQSRAEQAFTDIGSIGANTVRVVLSTGGRWPRVPGSAVADIIAWTRANRLVAVLEVHDSTGYAEQTDSVHPDDAVAYWLSSDIRSAIDGQEAFVIINIANEPFGNYTTEMWEPFHSGAVQELREAGLHHTLMVDAPNWGQDWMFVMRDGTGASSIFEADPDRNVVFSVHMYNVYKTANDVGQYFDGFLAKGLPMVVGEFAADHGAGDDNVVDEDAIMQNAEERGVGYLGWSWSENGSPLGSLDITRVHNVDDLTPWGERLIHGANGIAATAEPCSCFD